MRARIVFDLDGTLIDSAPDLHGIANAIMAQEGCAPIPLAQARSFIGQGVDVFVTRLRAARGIPDGDHARILAAFMARYHTAVHLTEPYPDVVATLQKLTDAGHALGLCTNKPLAPSRAVMEHLGIDGFFRTVWGGDSLPVHKPDPAPLNAAFAALPDGPEIYVGDSMVDAETAQRAMVPFLLFTGGYLHAPIAEVPHTAAFSHFADLPALVDRLLAEAA